MDGADPIAFSWTLVGGTTYSASISGHLPAKLFVDSSLTQLLPVPSATGPYDYTRIYNQFDAVVSGNNLFVRGALTPSAGVPLFDTATWVNVTNNLSNNSSQNFPLQNSGLQNVEATRGSWYAVGGTIFVNLADGSNPNAHKFYGTQRPYGVLMESVNYVTVKGLVFLHQQKSGILAVPFAKSTAGGSYFTNEYNQFLNNMCSNVGDIVTDSHTVQDQPIQIEGCIAVQAGTDYNSHILRGIVISGNVVGTFDSYYGLPEQQFQAGVVLSGADSPEIVHNLVQTHNAKGILYSNIGLYYSNGTPTLNHLGQVDYNELIDNQGNISYTQTVGGEAAYNKIHNSYGEGIQAGGGSVSTATVPQTFHHNVLYHLGKSAGQVLFNGFDCNGTLDGGYWLNNTVYDTNSASITLENGCTTAHVHNNIFDQNALRFPTYDAINPSYLMYYVSGSGDDAPDFSNNLWVNGGNPVPFRGTNGSYNCLTMFSSWPDKNSTCGFDPQFTNPNAGDFSLRSTSPAVGSGLLGSTIGALAE